LDLLVPRRQDRSCLVAGRHPRAPQAARPGLSATPIRERRRLRTRTSTCPGCYYQSMLIQMATSTFLPAASPTGAEALPMELARALGDPLRWRIVELLASEQLCVAHLAEELQTAQPLVSHHLKVLREAGLV